jgi:hypothetical protein
MLELRINQRGCNCDGGKLVGHAEDWLNRVGLTLQLVALFLVTPEIIGRERTKTMVKLFNPFYLLFYPLEVARNWSDDPESYLRRFRKTVFYIVAAAYVGTFSAILIISIICVIRYPLLLWIPPLFSTWIIGIWWLNRTFWKFVNRKNFSSLALGAWLFILGFVCLMWATFHPGEGS